MNLQPNETNRPFRLEHENINQRAPLPVRTLCPRLDDTSIESISLGSWGFGESAILKAHHQVEQSSATATNKFKRLSFQISARGKRCPGDSKRRGQLTHRELTEIVDVVAKVPSIATRPAFDGKTVTPLGVVLRSENSDMTLVQTMVEICIRHWAAQNFHMTKHPISECYPLNMPAEADGKLPLHVACKYDRTDIVRYIATTYPHGLTRRDHKGRLPIHTACAFGANKGIVSYLASMSPDTLWMADRGGRLPIHIACARGDRSTVDFLASICLGALATPDRNGRLPIHIACSTDDTDAVVDYLASTYPEALAKPDKNGKLPIDLVLEKRELRTGPSLPTIKKMLTLCPESLVVVQENTKSSALGRLLFRDFVELEILKTMVEVFPAVEPEVVLAPEDPTADALTMDTERAIEIAKLFGKVQSLHLEAKAWTQRAFCYFMDQLGNAPESFRRLSLTLPAYDLSKKHSDTREAFEAAMTKNESLSELRLSICQDDKEGIRETNGDIMMLKSLARGLKMRGGPLDKLELVDFKFPNASDLNCLALTTKALTLMDVQVMADAEQRPPVSSEGPQPCMEELSIHPGKGSTSSRYLSRMRQSLAGLRKLKVDWRLQNASASQGDELPCPLEFAHHLLSFVNTASELKTLTVKGCRLDCSKALKALRANKSIRMLHLLPRKGSPLLRVDEELVDLLEYHNSTLVQIEPVLPSSNEKLQAKYLYLLSLNTHGREVVRDKECQLGSFVSLISTIPQNATALVYGLLLERPDLWSSSSASDGR